MEIRCIFFLSELQDFNDNAPRFIRPPRNFTIRVPENASLGSEVIRVRAVDTDVGPNGEVRYRIRKDPLENYKSFRVDPVSGVITLARFVTRSFLSSINSESLKRIRIFLDADSNYIS